MKFLIFYIKVFLDAYRDTKRVIKHFNLISINGVMILPKLFYIKLVYSISFFRNFHKIKIKDNYSFNNLFTEKEIYSGDLTEKIDIDGHTETYTLKKELKEIFINEIFLNKDIEYKNKNNRKIDQQLLIRQTDESLTSYFEKLKINKISRITSFIDLKKNSSIKSFLTSKPVISLAKNYLNTNTISISSNFFISTPLEISREEKYSNAQYFHWDNDFSKFFKLYIYLTDVEEDSGPHIFIPKTHKNKLFESSLARLFDDDLIYNSYKNKIKYKGKSGSIFFTDGYGLHKGETPTQKPRLIINAHFGKGKIFYSNKDILYRDI